MKGAVGTSASFEKLLGKAGKARAPRGESDGCPGAELLSSGDPDVPPEGRLHPPILPRFDSRVCHKFGLDLRVLQSPPSVRLSEPMEELQVGSSAMPFKRNPVTPERMCSLARVVSDVSLRLLSRTLHNNILERTLDDSAAGGSRSLRRSSPSTSA